MTALLHIAGLHACFDGNPVLRGVSLAVQAGESVVLLGESGSGKTTLALAVTRLLAEPGGSIASGEILFQDRDLLRLEERQMRALRGRAIAMVFQEPQSALNPVMTIGQQLRECPQTHERGRVEQLLSAVGLDATDRILRAYPHQLSGGMRQRAMIAMALAGEPALLIADEPTSALDVTVQAQILDLLKAEQRRRRMALLLVTHDLGVARHMAERVAVLYDGQIVEEADAAIFFGGPCHPYSQALFAALPQTWAPDATPPAEWRPVPSEAGCAYAPRCPRRVPLCVEVDPPLTEYAGARVRCHRPQGTPLPAARAAGTGARRPPEPEPLLAVRGLSVRFKGGRGPGGLRNHEVVRAVSFDMETGQTLALVGESGSGKTTIARALLRLTPAYAGHIRFAGLDWSELAGEGLRRERPALQMIFQDPYGALNPRLQAGAIVSEGLHAQGQTPDVQALRALLRQVGLSEEMLVRYPHQFSGGQRQRLAIARALALRPKLLICDEPTSALDVSVQAQILGLLVSLQQQSGLSYLFITHNMAIVASLAHDVLVLFAGQIVERGPVMSVLQHPRHPYTRTLLAAVLPVTSKRGPAAQGGVPQGGIGEGPGCSFRFRCPGAQPLCVARTPEESVAGDRHRVRCHYPLDP